MIQVLDPSAEPGAAIEAYTPRFVPAAGKVIGLVSNAFTDSVAFLGDIQAELADHLPGVEYLYFTKQSIRYSSFPLSEEKVKEITAQCDAVITAYGHCGSCTSGTIRDAANLARSGVPVVALVTEKFADEARFVARAVGIPDVPVILMPHPVAGRDRDFHRRLASELAQPLVDALVTGQAVA
jgi:hypothetical protein